MKIPLLGGTGSDREDDNAQALTRNWYPSKLSGKSQLVLYPTPGLTQFADVGAGPIRGSIEYGDEYYIVSGDGFYKVSEAGAGSLQGTLNTSNGRVAIAHNGFSNGQQIILADGVDVWIYDTSGTPSFTQITQFNDAATAMIAPTHVQFIDSYFVANDPSTSGRFYISSSYDGSDWDVLDFATAERSPDDLEGLVVSNRSLWLVGSKTSELWWNSGDATFTFAPMQQGFSQWGTIAPDSLLEISGTTFWLSKNEEGAGLVVATNGTTPSPVSSGEVAVEISKLTTLSDAYAWTYQYQQHSFYVLTFPTDGKTFVYDLSINEWHEWSSKTLGYHRSSNHIYVYNKHLVGDPSSGKIYELDWGTYTDAGDIITRVRRSKIIHGEDKELIHDGVWVDIKEGVGNSSSTDPQLQLRWRDSNGSWSNYHPRSMGKVGERGKRLIWRSLGRSFDRVYEITTSEPVNAVIVDAYARLRSNKRELG